MLPLALPALVIGAVAIGFSPILVRLSELGPFATAFWRVALALPLLFLWMAWERRASAPRPAGPWLPARPLRRLLPAGLFFAGDLIFWHLSILNTTVANATLFANFAPVVVAIGAWAILRERMTGRFAIGLLIAMAGAGLLVGASFEINPAHVVGDASGMVTAFFFGAYMLAVRVARGNMSAATIMFWSGVVTAAALLVVTIGAGERVMPMTLYGWGVLIVLAWICHAAGQGLLAFGLGHLPASFSSLVILIEPLAAAVFGWLILSEALTPLQGLGGAVILTGILIARRATRPAPPRPTLP
jgi:drug/metabolite transporter (DMT)-like permease